MMLNVALGPLKMCPRRTQLCFPQEASTVASAEGRLCLKCPIGPATGPVTTALFVLYV